jgi:hypothetical protein
LTQKKDLTYLLMKISPCKWSSSSRYNLKITLSSVSGRIRNFLPDTDLELEVPDSGPNLKLDERIRINHPKMNGN